MSESKRAKEPTKSELLQAVGRLSAENKALSDQARTANRDRNEIQEKLEQATGALVAVKAQAEAMEAIHREPPVETQRIHDGYVTTDVKPKWCPLADAFKTIAYAAADGLTDKKDNGSYRY